ncbi:MAG TPA: DMT family transporter, partial [Thermoleophilaceae bacterium]
GGTGIAFVIYYTLNREIGPTRTSLVAYVAPVFAVVYGVTLLDENFGVAIGILGVALLLGVDVEGSGLGGGLMVVLASVGYAIGGFALKRFFTGYQPLALVAGTMTASAVMTLPLFLIDLPGHVGLDTIGAMSALGLGGTGIAFVIYYTLNREIGPTRTSLVAYVAPVFALVYGVTLLDENFGVATALGIVLIVGGSWLAAKSPARVPVEASQARQAEAAA